MSNLIRNTITSMEVAKMVGKEHSKLLRDIRNYVVQLGEAKIGFTDFFKEATYTTEQNKILPCFQVTKKGCEFIAHKCTGQKGVVFTARYINKFHELEEKANKNRLIHVSDKPAPRAITFYKRNLSRIELFAKIGEFTKREAIDELISYASTRFDMEEATIQYIVDVGEKPRYRLDIFDYFPEIGEFGEEYLKFMIDFNLSSYAERRKKKNGSKEA